MTQKRLDSLAPNHLQLLRTSLVFVWLTTALVSAVEYQGQSLTLLTRAGIQDLFIAHCLIWSGIAADVALGLALWRLPRRTTYLATLAVMLLMTLIATLLSPALWLHPLGPLLKNIPIGVVLWILAKEAP